MCCMPPSHLILHDLFIIIIHEGCKLCSSLLHYFLQPPITSYLSDPDIFLSTLFSNTLYLCSFLNVRYQVSCPCKTTDIIIVLYGVWVLFSPPENMFAYTFMHGFNFKTKTYTLADVWLDKFAGMCLSCKSLGYVSFDLYIFR